MGELKYREKWSREETILAYDLFCRIPFSKISKTNKDIIALAEIIGRTPSSVGLKMSNLAHFDPDIIASNRKGMANASKLDKEIVDEFKYDWFGLSNQAQQILAKYKNVDVIQLNPEFDPTLNLEQIPEGLDLKKETKIRVGQYFFRQSILNSYGNACCVTGISNKELLVASHIKPWKDSDEKTERTNPKNGLCLNALHDKAFDKGLITIDKNYCIILSPKIAQTNMDDNTKNWFYSYSKRQINLPDKFYPGKDFIEYHNDVIFQK